MINYLGEILRDGAGIRQEKKRFAHDSYPKAIEWETGNPMQTNQSALVGMYVVDRSGIISCCETILNPFEVKQKCLFHVRPTIGRFRAIM